MPPCRLPSVFVGSNARAEAAGLRKRTYSIWGGRATGADRLHAFRGTVGPLVLPWRRGAFLRAGSKFLLDPTTPAAALLGNILCLAHFYELRRCLPAQVGLASVSHARHADDCFASIDGSRSLHFVIIETLSAAQYLTAVQEQDLGLGTWFTPRVVYWGNLRGRPYDRHWPAARPFWK